MYIINKIISELPEKPGVYFFYNENGDIIYIGKSINIKKRVQQHFKSKDRKSIKIQTFTKSIKYELTGSELIALLHESDLIKTHQPIYNRAQRKTVYAYGLYLEQVNDYKGLFVRKINNAENEITVFSTLSKAKEALFKITEKYNLCQKINGLYKTSNTCFQYQIKECKGACISKESAEEYNKRVDLFVYRNVMKKFTRCIELPGRTENEKGLVLIENGVYKGFGYCNSNENSENYSNFLELKNDNKDVRRILMRYLLNETKV